MGCMSEVKVGVHTRLRIRRLNAVSVLSREQKRNKTCLTKQRVVLFLFKTQAILSVHLKSTAEKVVSQ